MAVVGDYPVVVSGTYLEKDFEESYTVSVKDAVTYVPKSLDYDYRNLNNNKSYEGGNGWYMPNGGNVKSLVIPVWFTNSGSMISNKNDIRNKIDIAFNGEQLENGWNSVKTYYYELSNHTLNYNATISDWYEPGNTFSYYEQNGNNHKQLVCDAVDWYFANNPTDSKASYDSDNNGVYDSICILYGSNESDTGMIHFESYYNKTDANNPGLKYHMWASVFETTDDLSHCDGDSHVFIHETGHMLGLCDYYDYGGDTQYEKLLGKAMTIMEGVTSALSYMHLSILQVEREILSEKFEQEGFAEYDLYRYHYIVFSHSIALLQDLLFKLTSLIFGLNVPPIMIGWKKLKRELTKHNLVTQKSIFEDFYKKFSNHIDKRNTFSHEGLLTYNTLDSFYMTIVWSHVSSLPNMEENKYPQYLHA